MRNELGEKINIIHDVPRHGDVKRNYSDISKAKRILGFSPEVNLDKGLKKTYDYFRSKNKQRQ